MEMWLLNPPYFEKVYREGRCEQKQGLFQTSYPPLTLATLASILRKRYSVHLIDCIGSGINLTVLCKLYEKERPKKIFVSISTQTIDRDLQVIAKLNSISKAEFLIFGVHATYFYKELSKHKYIKVIRGDPEKYATELIGEEYNFVNLPIPSWDLVDLNRYILPLRNKPFVLVKASKGCPYNCTFCVTGKYSGKQIKTRPVNKIIDELRYILKIGINDVLFFADTFTYNKAWCRALSAQMIKEKLKIFWICNSRVDTVDYSTLKLMKKAGLWLISFGIESGDQTILEKSKKGITISQAKKAVAWANSVGILTLGHFIIGLPGETQQTIKKTIQFSKSLNLDFAAFYLAVPFPGSELYELYRHTPKDWSKYEYSTQIMRSDLNLIGWQKKAVKQFYFANIPHRLKKIVQVLGYKSIPGILSSSVKTIINFAK
jgi:anaerobic magnesium-protoporphyrin IX monomethyl ester cyclase